MSDKSIIEQIKHYQKDITKCPDNSKRMLRCIERLTVLPITIGHLQETGVGRSVNELRKCGGEVGAAAGSLVCKWKSMVKDEEEEDDEESAPESDTEESKEHYKSPRPDHRNDPTQKGDSFQKHIKDHDNEDHRKSVSSNISNKKTESTPIQSPRADHRNDPSQKCDSFQKYKKDHNKEDHRKPVSSNISSKKTESTPTQSPRADHKNDPSQKRDSSQKHKKDHDNEDYRKSGGSSNNSSKKNESTSESRSSKSSDQRSSSKSNHKSSRDNSIKSGYNSCSDSKSSSHHRSKTDYHSKSHKIMSHTSKFECNGSIKIEKSYSKPKLERTSSSTSNSDSDFSDAKTKDLKYKRDKEKRKKEESSHKHNSSHKKYDLKRVESDSSEDDDIYKPTSRKHKKSDSEEEQKYDINKRSTGSFSKSSVKKKKQYESSEESDNNSESDVEDGLDNEEQRSVSQNSSDNDSQRSDKSNTDNNISDNESDNDSRSSVEESGDQEDNHSEEDSDYERNDSPEREKYSAVKIKREKESPPKHSKHQNSERNKSIHNKSNHSSKSLSKKFKADNVIDKKDHYENIKVKKEKEDSNNLTIKNSEKLKEKVNKISSDKKNLTKSSSSHSEGPNKQEKKVKVKIEKAEDGSIDCVSGASFGDALLGLSETKKKPLKRKPTSNEVKSPKHSEKPKSSTRLDHRSTPSSSISTYKGTELLSKNIKLEPLDVDLKATLPEISPHYKPLPHYSPPSSPANKKAKLLSQEEALSTIMSTKNQRTKVYSGNKTGFTKVPSLFELCIQVLRENIEALEYTGGVPYDLLKPVLDRATADQLYQLEHFNPYLVEDTDGLWQFHCNKDFRGKKPEEFETWRELYLRLLDEREKKLEALKANISQSMAKSTPIRQTKLAYVDSVVKPPRNIAKKQMKYGTAKAVKHDLVAKAMVGAASSAPAPEVVSVPAPPAPRSHSSTSSFPIPNFLKKKKAPLMAKTLQLIKGNRFKR